MPDLKRQDGFYFEKPGIYHIRVIGSMGENLSKRLGGMSITTDDDHDFEKVTSLVGKMRDQAELSGVLNMLYEQHYTLLYVEFIRDMKAWNDGKNDKKRILS